jgi:multiple sugar transport system substrate-binding protein
VRTIALLAGAALLLTSCGGIGAGATNSGGKSLTTAGFGLPDEMAKVRVDRFKQRNPGVTVTINQGALDDQQFLSSVASGRPADVIYLDRYKIGSYATRGALQPIDSCLRRQHVNVGDFRPAAIQSLKMDGRTYGLPDFASLVVLMVNDSVLASAGLKPSDVDTRDWNRLADVARKLAKVSGGKVSRLGFDPKLPEDLPLWAKANGADLLSADGRRPNLTDPKVVEALGYTTGLIKAQGGWADFKAFREPFDFFGAGNPFTRDQLGAMPGENFFISSMADTSPDVDLTVLPFRDRQGDPLTVTGGNAWAIPKGARHPDEACRWITTMTDAGTWMAAARARAAKRAAEGKVYSGTFTGNARADQEIFSTVVKPSGHPRFDDAVKTMLAAQDHAFAVPPSPAGAEFKAAWQEAVNRVLFGRQSPRQALVQAQQEAEQALAKAARG